MPINILRDVAVEHLSSIGFERPGSYFKPSVRGCLKTVILNGNGVTISVLGKNSFRVSVQADRYYESLVSDFHFSLQKVIRQRESMNILLENNGPGAWMLVTAYYQSFYAAIQIARLSGLYNMTINAKYIEALNDLNETQVALSEKGVYLSVGTYLDKEQGSIITKFSKTGSKPHQLAWSNVFGLLPDSEVGRLAEGRRLQRIGFFKEIIGSHKKSTWITPSDLRNKWNYSLVDSYDKDSDLKLKKLAYILKEKKFDRAKSWCDTNKKDVGDEDLLASMGYVCVILENVIANISSRLLCD